MESLFTRIGCPFGVTRTCTTSSHNPIPKEKMLVPSRNFLTKEAYQESQGKLCSTHNVKNHCLSMSLQFLSEYSKTGKVTAAAETLREGANARCAEITEIYSSVFDKTESNLEARQAAMKEFGLDYENISEVDYTFEELHQFLRDRLPVGKYLLNLPGHATALVKQPDGTLYLYDPNHGLAKIDRDSKECGWFKSVLNESRAFIADSITLTRVEDKTLVTNQTKKPMKYESPEAVLTAGKVNGSWQDLTMKWRGKEHRFVKDLRTNEIYNGDPKSLIRAKCAGLLFATPVITAIRMLFNAVMTLLRILYIPITLFLGKERFVSNLSLILTHAMDVIRAPLYGVMGEVSALVGVFSPYEGRKYYGYAERSFNRHNSHVDLRAKFYMAPCATPLNFNAEDKNCEKLNFKYLKGAIRRYDAYMEAFRPLKDRKIDKDGNSAPCACCIGAILCCCVTSCCPEICYRSIAAGA